MRNGRLRYYEITKEHMKAIDNENERCEDVKLPDTEKCIQGIASSLFPINNISINVFHTSSDYVQQMVGCRLSWYRHPLNLTVCSTKEEFEDWKRLTIDLNEIGESNIFYVSQYVYYSEIS